MTVTEEFRRGTGGDPNNPPLEQGAATAANEALDEGLPLADQEPLSPEEEQFLLEEEEEEEEDVFEDPDILAELDDGVEADREAREDGFSPASEEEQVLFAPDSLNAFEELAFRQRTLPPPPRGMGEWLPSLAVMARDPSAPPGVKALFNTIVDTMFPPEDEGVNNTAA